MKFPTLAFKLRAPIELENLLPYDIQYRIYDKNTDQQWKSYLRHGGIMPVHSVELAHLVLLNITIQDSGTLKPLTLEVTQLTGTGSLPSQRFRHHQRRWPLRLRGRKPTTDRRPEGRQTPAEAELRVTLIFPQLFHTLTVGQTLPRFWRGFQSSDIQSIRNREQNRAALLHEVDAFNPPREWT